MIHLSELTQICDMYLIDDRRAICDYVLEDERFVEAPGGAKHHHNYRGGLVEHTLEVGKMAMQFARGYGRLVESQALIAALFHDFGKILEYEFKEDGTIGTTSFKDQIGHVVFSAGHFADRAQSCLNPAEIDAIYHAILAHHGRREWGSPVEPATPLAWALHSADMLSSRGYYKPKAEAQETLPALVHLEGWKSNGTLAGGKRTI